MINKMEYANGGFYPLSYDEEGNLIDNIYGENLPEERIDVTEIYEELMLGQAKGGRIMPPDDEHSLPWLKEVEVDLAAARKAEIESLLSDIDQQSVRPMRAILDGTATDEDRQKLADLEAQAEQLRAELAELEKLN